MCMLCIFYYVMVVDSGETVNENACNLFIHLFGY